jgi:23S rRNA (guanosine2251-2'-O)-methyltransferase
MEHTEDQWLAGKHPVLEALRSGRPIHKVWIAEGAAKHQTASVVQAAKEAGVPVQFVDRRRLDQTVPGVNHQGVAAQAAALEYADVDDIFAAAERKGEPPLLILLDEIEDPHNLGSILRTADSAGAHGVIIPRRRSVGLTATVAKTSAGAVAYVPVARVANLAQTIDMLKERGVWVAGADASAEQDVYASDLTGPIALVIGNENRGLGRLIREKCDFLVKLPMLGRIQSLNASVAAGVLLYEIVRQRRSAAAKQ